MTPILLITKADFIPYVDLPANVDAVKKINMHIEHAQQFDLKPLLGDVLYYDLLKNSTEEKYVTLLDGQEYEVNGVPVLFKGLKPAIVHFATARVLPNISSQITPSGMFQKRNEFSDPVDFRDISRQVKYFESLAHGYWAEARAFLDQNSDTYTHWRSNKCESPRASRNSGARIYGVNSYGRR
ncbi:hypothetical protein [Pedobacter sp. SYSU D00535]|uniref:DUF6712 family protein n=1 Tax=Pedobacter sp. SYSU D00535 TaxID=2810308 RepID=UPI001A973A25|nr:hypothetical protein [Pedobacter sp. SYSU D00535]